MNKDAVPVLFLEIKTGVSILSLSARSAADDQMRLRLRQFYDAGLSTLYGLSALGTKVCKYAVVKETRKVTPPFIKTDQDYVNDAAPAERWNMDVTTEDGFGKLEELAADIKTMAAFESKLVDRHSLPVA